MPRIRQDRYQVACARPGCERMFFQDQPGQLCCSRDCANKMSPGTGGKKPAAGLEQRECENPQCRKLYQPYRSTQRTCSKACHRKRPDVVAQAQDYRAQQGIRDRKNTARRTDPNQVTRIRAYNRRTTLARWGWTPEQYEQALEEQQGRCQICGSTPKPDGIKAESRLHADHDHATGQRRNLLCASCNKGLGLFKDDPELLSVAADYVLRHRKMTVA